MIDGNDSKKSTYLTIYWNGKQYNALLDTGCEVSVISHRLIPKDTVLTSPEADLFAANRTKISLLGRTDMDFVLDGKTYSITLAVTDAIDELILGIDFLTKYAATWEIATGKLHLDGKCFLLQPRVTANKARRVYSAEDMFIPAMTRTSIPVNITKLTIQACDEWEIEPITVHKGLQISRMCIQGDATKVVMCIANQSPRDYRIGCDAEIGSARKIPDSPAEEYLQHPFVDAFVLRPTPARWDPVNKEVFVE